MSEPSPEALLWSLVRGAMATQALRVAADAGVADALADRPRPVSELAAEAGVNADALHRFLRALAAEGVFAEDEPGVFRNTPASALLQSEDEQRWRDFALQFGDDWYRAFAEAPLAVRSGAPTFEQVFGCDFEERLRRSPDRLERFSRSMESGAADRIERLEDAGLQGARVVVDIGGGTGAMMIELLRRYPDARGVVFDLPEVASHAETRIAAAGLAERCEVVGGSFLDGVPPGGDVYLLSRILHGLGDTDAANVLRHIAAAGQSGARVLILDSVVPAGNEPHGSKWLDLLMLVLSGGRERTANEWRQLLEGAGLRVDSIVDGLIQALCAPA